MKEVVVTLAGHPRKLPRTVREVTGRRRRNDAALRSKTPRPVARYSTDPFQHNEHKPLMSRVNAFVFSALQSGEEEDGEGDEDEKGTPKNRKKIRKIIKDDNLRTETRDALKEEEERRRRIAERERLREKLREVDELLDADI